MHKPIFLKSISLCFTDKICFESFSIQIQPTNRIAIVGNNGSGKSTLLKIIKGDVLPSSGTVENNKDVSFGYIPQLIYEYKNLSGGEKFNKILNSVFAVHPDILLLDEPTNHLDLKNRKALIKMLDFYKGTLIIASHDVELLRSSVDILWHIRDGIINVFNGKYDDYRQIILQKRQYISDKLRFLAKEKKEVHEALMKEQQRAKKSKKRGKKLVNQKRWLPAVGDLKASCAQKNAGKKQQLIVNKRNSLNDNLSNLKIPERIIPHFSLTSKYVGSKSVVSISNGTVGYKNKTVLIDVNLSVTGSQRLAIIGDNGSGKTTLLRAILSYPQVIKTGIWSLPRLEDIGYLDQHYSSLDSSKTVLETLITLNSGKTHIQIRDFLNDFLFRKNEEVNKQVSVLSGGEQARLSLAKIALQPPKLLLIDEITNNIDLETKEHITQVLEKYEGAMIIVSHDATFLEDIGITYYYTL